jgi:hypothetical protein
MPLRLCFAVAGRPIRGSEPKLIVDPSPVADSALAIQNDHLRRPPGAESIGNCLPQVFENRERDLVAARVSGDLGHGILSIRVDSEERSALRLIFARKLDEPWRIEFSQRTVDSNESKHDQFVAINLGQRKCLAQNLLGAAVLDDIADRDHAGGFTVRSTRSGNH